jgi:ABC-type multidrug transport system permease subunit
MRFIPGILILFVAVMAFIPAGSYFHGFVVVSNTTPTWVKFLILIIGILFALEGSWEYYRWRTETIPAYFRPFVRKVRILRQMWRELGTSIV